MGGALSADAAPAATLPIGAATLVVCVVTAGSEHALIIVMSISSTHEIGRKVMRKVTENSASGGEF